MATAPAKTGPKIVAPIKPDDVAPVPPKKSKMKLVVILLLLVLLGGGGGAAWYFMGQDANPATKKAVPPKPPVYLALEPFTVNLHPENGEQYLQIAFTLQVSDLEQVELIKLHLPQARSRLLLLLSGKKASEINTADGKKKLSGEIIAATKAPFTPQTKPADVTDVFFTSFVIQ